MTKVEISVDMESYEMLVRLGRTQSKDAYYTEYSFARLGLKMLVSKERKRVDR